MGVVLKSRSAGGGMLWEFLGSKRPGVVDGRRTYRIENKFNLNCES